MKTLTILTLTLLSLTVLGQQRTDKYHDYFGHKIEFFRDSTFKYAYGFDLIHTWAIGKWTTNKDTIYLNFDNNKVYDTLVRANRPDSLIESRDEISSRINEESFAMQQLSSGGQSSEGITNRLIKRNGRLYLVDHDGKRIKERREGIWRQKKWWGYKKWPVWYVKET